MIPDMDRPRQFNDILDAAEGDPDALDTAASSAQSRDRALAADLRLVAALRRVAPSRAELDNARLRVGQRLVRDVLANASEQGAGNAPLKSLRLSEPPVTMLETEIIPATVGPARCADEAPVASTRSWWVPTRRNVWMGAAAATLLLVLGAGLSVASADSQPDSPLYGIKRAEESALLALPLGSSGHAQVLGMVATRRLEEAQAEARAHHDTQAATLLHDYDSDMVQLITLAATVHAQGGDTSAVTTQITQVIKTQATIQQASVSLDDATFKTALGQSADTVQETLAQQNVTLPSAQNPAGNQNGQNGQPTATPGVSPTPSPTATPSGKNGGHGHGHGHNTNNGGS